jgi:tetratricopeptide (TPR) repeat protein
MRLRLLSVAFLLSACWWTPQLFGDPKLKLRQGIQAHERRQYDAAVRAFREAIAESGQEYARRDILIVGDRYEPYLPYYWLALSLAQLGRCGEALEALGVSESQGALRAYARYNRNVARIRSDCPPPVERPLVADTTTAPPPRTQTTEPAPVTTPVPAPVEPVRTASTTRDEAPATVAVTTSQPAVAPPPAPVAPAPDPRLAPLQARLRREIAAAQQLRGVTVPNPTPQWTQAQAALRRTLANAGAAGASADFAQLTRVLDELGARSRAVAALVPARSIPAPVPPPDQLKVAVAAFFRGEYSRAVETLQNAQFTDTRAVAQSFLIRGAARYSLFLANGERDSGLRDAALADIAAFRRADPTGTLPLPQAFSPRLRKVLEGSVVTR